MGRVFTWKEIRDDKVPKAENFKDVLEKLRQELSADQDVIGAVICGSVGSKTYGPRSDIDCLVLHKQSDVRAYPLESMTRIMKYAYVRNVPMEFLPIDAALAASGAPGFDAPFGLHLKKMVDRGNLIKDNPLLICRIEKERVAYDVTQYISRKCEKLSKYLIALNSGVATEDEICYMLKKALEAPTHVARKVLLWLGKDLENDSKVSVYGEFEAAVGGRLWHILRDTLRPIENEYNENLKTRVKEKVKNWAAYHQLIVNLKKIAAPMAYHFVRECGLFISSRPFVEIR